MSWKSILLAAVSAGALIGAWPAGADAQSAVSYPVTFDLTKTHPFNGIGFEDWITSEHQTALQTVFSDLRPSFVRLGNVAPSVAPGELQTGMSVADIMALLAKRQSAAYSASTARSAAMLRSLGIHTHLIVWQMPGDWAESTRFTDSKGHARVKYVANPLHVQDYANYIAAQVNFAVQAGFGVSFVELSNEPEGWWDTFWTPALFAQLVHAARQALDANGAQHIRIEAPGTGSMASAAPYVAALAADVAAGDLGGLSVHAWDTRFGPEFVGVPKALRDAIAQLPAHLNLDITEYSEDSPHWYKAPYSHGPSQRGDNNSADTIDYGVALAGETLLLIGDGASQLSFWQAQDLSWGFDSRGLADLNGNIRPSEHALRAALAMIPAGSAVSQGVSEASGLVADAFFHAHGGVIQTVTVDLANMSTTGRTVSPAFTGKVGHVTKIKGTLDFFDTETAHKTEIPVTLEDGVVTVKMPPRSVVSLKLAF